MKLCYNGLDPYPEVAIDEDYANLGELEDINEPLLAATLNEIFPAAFQQRKGAIKFEKISESKAHLPTYQLMVSEQ